jgi:hypothetical protein
VRKRAAASSNLPLFRTDPQALQLIEYLLKSGSDRVVDNVREHLYEIKSLKNFQFIDEKQKDQGINGRRLLATAPT